MVFVPMSSTISFDGFYENSLWKINTWKKITFLESMVGFVKNSEIHMKKHIVLLNPHHYKSQD